MADRQRQNLQALLSALVRRRLDILQWSQYRLSQETGVSQKHISQLLRGKTAGSVDVWDRLLKAVGGDEDDGVETVAPPKEN